MENSGTHEHKEVQFPEQPPTSAIRQHWGKRVVIYFGIAVVAVLTWRVFVLLATRPTTLALVLIAIITAVLLLVLALWWLPKWQVSRSEGVSPANRFDRENEARKTLAQIIGGIFVLAGLYSSLQTLALQTESLRTTREGQITDRFTKAIDQLGSVDANGAPKLEIRLGGIYALERIAGDSDKDHWAVMEVLTAYIRENASLMEGSSAIQQIAQQRHPVSKAQATKIIEEKTLPRADIQAILNIVGRRNRAYEHLGQELDLNITDLQRVDLRNAHLERAHLISANLEGAHLEGAHLEGAYLGAADLKGAYLRGAYFEEAHMEGASLYQADLARAHFETAHDLTQEQVDSAFGNEGTQLPPNLKRPANWLK